MNFCYDDKSLVVSDISPPNILDGTEGAFVFCLSTELTGKTPARFACLSRLGLAHLQLLTVRILSEIQSSSAFGYQLKTTYAFLTRIDYS